MLSGTYRRRMLKNYEPGQPRGSKFDKRNDAKGEFIKFRCKNKYNSNIHYFWFIRKKVETHRAQN